MKISTVQIVFFLSFLFLKVSLFSQNTALDSLEIELQNHKENDSIRVNLLNDLANSYRQTDMDKALTYLKESEAIAEAIDFKKGKAKSLYLKAIGLADQSNYQQGISYYYDAIALYESIDSKKGLGLCYNGVGRFYYKNGNQNQAIENYKKSLVLYEELGDDDEVFATLNNIGWSLIQIGDYDQAITFYKKALNDGEHNDKALLSYCLSDLGIIYTHKSNYPLALEYFNKSLSVGRKNNDSISLGNTLGNMGPVYNHLQRYDKAIECYQESNEYLKNTNKQATASNFNNIGLVYMDKQEYMSAIDFLTKAREEFRGINNKAGEALSLNNLGHAYIALYDYVIASQYFERAVKLNIEVDNQFGLSNSYLGISKVLVNKKQYDQALTYAIKSQNIAYKLGLVDFQRDASKLLVEIYKHKGQLKKALASHEQFKKLNDSLFNKESIEKIAQLESEYKYRQALDSASIRELKLTREVSSINTNLEKSQRNILLTIIAFLLTALVLAGIIFSLKWRNIKERNQNALIEQKLLRSQMTPHFIFNSLSVLQGMILNKEEEKSISYLSKFSKLLRIVLENSRDKVVPLKQELDAIDSYMVLQNLDTDPPYDYSLVVEENIDINAVQIPPMLIQPFIENAIEHAFETQKDNREIAIHLKFIEAKLVCTITDNGMGIDGIVQQQSMKKKSLATTITSERLLMLSKEFKVPGGITILDRKKNKERGTRVTLVIPYKVRTNS